MNRLLAITPRHERGHPSVIEVAVDTGLKSGKLTVVHIGPDEALLRAEELLAAARIVSKSNRERA